MAQSVFAKDRSALAARGEAILDVLANNSTDTEWGAFLQAAFERAAAKGDGPMSLALLRAGAKGCHLHPAIRGGQPELVNKLLGLGASATVRDDSGDSPIHVAAAHGGGSIAQTLLEIEEVDANEENGKGCTPMHLACLLGGDAPTIKALLDAGAKLRPRLGKTKAGFTPFDLAARSGHEGVMATLRDAGVSGKLRSSTDGEILHQAAAENNVPMIDFLVVEAKTDVNFRDEQGASPLHAAAFKGSCAAMTALMKHGADLSAVNDAGYTPLHFATEGGDVTAVELLCETRVGLNARFSAVLYYPPEQDDWSALDVAANTGNVAALKALVKAGAKLHAVSSEGLTVMHSAAAGDSAETIDALVELGLDVKGSGGGTPVVEVAALANSPNAVCALARHGADLDELNSFGESPIQAAAEWVHGLSMTKTLLEAGASPLLHQVLGSQHFEEIAQVFFENGAELSAKDGHGNTVLHAAAMEHGAERIDFLINAGADVDAASDLRSWTPLHLACFSRNAGAVVALLKHGARKDAVDVFDHTPLHIAAAAAGLPKSIAMPPGTSAGIVDALLKAGAAPEPLNKGGLAPADLVLNFPRDYPRFDEDVKPVLNLLLSPDMMWRRRAVWMLCRAYPGRAEVGLEGTHSNSTTLVRSGGSGAAGDAAEAVVGALGDAGSAGFGGIAARLLSLDDDNVFRTILCFL